MHYLKKYGKTHKRIEG